MSNIESIKREIFQNIRLLKENNIAVYFEKENINTLDACLLYNKKGQICK